MQCYSGLSSAGVSAPSLARKAGRLERKLERVGFPYNCERCIYRGKVAKKQRSWYLCKESKENMMELAKVTSKGQITIPVQIRKKLKLKEGDKVFFIEEKGKVFFQNASQVALKTFQEKMQGEALKAGFASEEDVANYISNLRKNNGK
jgi:antitoxin PrlF